MRGDLVGPSECHARALVGATLFKPLAFQGDIVFGPNQGTRVTFARPDQITAHWQPLPHPDEAAPLVISAYLSAYGPASPLQVRHWLARGRISGKQNKHWFALLGDALTKIDVDGEEMYVRTEDADSLATAKPSQTGAYSVARLVGPGPGHGK